MVEQGLELMHLVGEELVQLTSVNHVTHLQLRHIYVLFY